jgi:hypothetical protein
MGGGAIRRLYLRGGKKYVKWEEENKIYDDVKDKEMGGEIHYFSASAF